MLAEVMYSIALAFLFFDRKYSLPSKFHYQVFHAISFFENEFNVVNLEDPKPAIVNQCDSNKICKKNKTEKKKFMLTAEQARIANHKLVKGRDEYFYQNLKFPYSVQGVNKKNDSTPDQFTPF